MKNNKINIALILAGGRGERLGSLTHYYSKPAVFYGGTHRIIDFTLSNCKHSGIKTIGLLSQYFSTDLHMYVDHISSNGQDGFIYTLPSQKDKKLYSGTANAVYQNIEFLEKINPKNVLILAGDHIYKMDYRKMLSFHEKTYADITVAVTHVPHDETSRFGILSVDRSKITKFEEKPQKTESNLASMGIYVFKWDVLKKILLSDSENNLSAHDFGKNIIPMALNTKKRLFAYEFNDYWRDVGTVYSLWESNMDLLGSHPAFDIYGNWEIFTSPKDVSTNYIFNGSQVVDSVISSNCNIAGKVEHSILSDFVTMSKGSEVLDSVIMPNVFIGKNVKIHKAIIGPWSIIMDNVEIGSDKGSKDLQDEDLCMRDVSLVAPWTYIPENMSFNKSSHIDKVRLSKYCASNTAPNVKLKGTILAS